jgi:chemotaxis protein methyltransferase CheR
MPIAPTQLAYLCDLVYRRSAIVLTAEKEYLVESRLAPVARSAGFESVEALIIALRTPAGVSLQALVVEAMTTNETSFFRDHHPFEALRQELLPKLKAARASTKSLVIMSAACSTGQEAYSLAMMLQEPALDMAAWRIRILGFDLSEAVLSRARAGVYTQGEVNRGLPAPMLLEHFDRVGSEWQIKKALRDKLEVWQMNLMDPWPAMPRIDLFFMRNVLIYFDVAAKRAVLARARSVLAPDGYLVLGGAETTLNLDERFARVPVGRSTVYRPIA